MTLALSASLVAASAMLHRVTGVGFALLVFPLLVVIHGPRVGLGAGFVLGLTASLIVLVQCWRQVSLTRAVQLAVPSLVAIPAGAWVVRHTPTAILTIAIGLFIAVALVVGPVHRIPPLSGVKPAAAAGAAAGFTHVTSVWGSKSQLHPMSWQFVFASDRHA